MWSTIHGTVSTVNQKTLQLIKRHCILFIIENEDATIIFLKVNVTQEIA